MKNSEVFWITNISNRNVSLADLNITIKSFSSINLLDNKHYSFTKEQLLKSAKDGSIFKKRDKIFVRKVPPHQHLESGILISDNTLPFKERSLLVINENKYEELNVDDVKYAEENAELAEMDQQPLIKKGYHGI
jgi:hypothetical protein